MAIEARKKTGFGADSKGQKWERKITPDKWRRIMGFIFAYQATNGGRSPSVRAIAHHMEMSDRGVGFHLAKMEDLGLIVVIIRNPYTVKVVNPEEKEVKATATRLATAWRGKKMPQEAIGMSGNERWLACESKRQMVARCIGQSWADRGHGPSLRELMDCVGYGKAEPVMGMLADLRARGLVDGEGTNRYLTHEGKAVFGFSGEKPKRKTEETKMEPKEKTVVVVAPVGYNRKWLPRVDTLKDIARRIQDHWDRFGVPPYLLDLTVARAKTTGGLSPIIAYMRERGWLTHTDGKHRDYALTDLGREVLLDRPVVSEADVEEMEAMFEKPVEDVAPPVEPVPEEPQGTLVGGASGIMADLHRADPFLRRAAETVIDSSEWNAHPPLVVPQPFGDNKPPLTAYEDGALVMELINRGYMVTKR